METPRPVREPFKSRLFEPETIEELAPDAGESDFTIYCQGREWHVHSHVLAKHSKYFEVLCNGEFLEATQRTADLSFDPSHIIFKLLSYLYTSKYNGATSSELLTLIRQRVPDFIPNQPERQRIFGALHIHLASLTHAHMYAAADKYGICGLRTLSSTNFRQALTRAFGGKEYCATSIEFAIQDVVEEVWASVPACDKGLKEIFAEFYVGHRGALRGCEGFRELLAVEVDIALDLLDVTVQKMVVAEKEAGVVGGKSRAAEGLLGQEFVCKRCLGMKAGVVVSMLRAEYTCLQCGGASAFENVHKGNSPSRRWAKRSWRV